MADSDESLWRRDLNNDTLTRPAAFEASDQGAAAIGAVAGAGALLSAAACCVLPLALAALGIGAGGLAAVVPFHWPMTIAAALAVAVGWFLYLRKRRACAVDASCTVAAPTRATPVMLSFATVFIALSALWPSYLEKPLLNLLGSA